MVLNMLHELRVHQPVSSERFEASADGFQRIVAPAFARYGCHVAGVWRGDDDPPPFVSLLSFRDRAHRESSYKALLAEDAMVSEYLSQRAKSIASDEPNLSWILDPVADIPFRSECHPYYEARMYTPHEGLMADYARTFADEVVPLFERLDAPVLGGWSGTQMGPNFFDMEPGAPAPFVYLLGFRDRAHREEVFLTGLRDQPEMAGYLAKRAELINSDVPIRYWLLKPLPAVTE
jgi:hypothetical protein